jgi:NAD(P)-dependent dehydrogenase (short-subunit alcohol dehydrogenase family)
MKIVLTGASRGIGLGLLEFGLNKDHNFLAIVRNPSEEILLLERRFSGLEVLNLDLALHDSEKLISEAVKSWDCVDVLINNAGVYLDDDRVDSFNSSFLVNAIKPFLIARELKSKLKKASRPLTISLTSQMGSLGDNKTGGSYSYRSSKAALNMIFKSFSLDEKEIISLLIHPGWVKTRMGGSAAPVMIEESVCGIWQIIDHASLSQSGSFIDYLGRPIEW